MKSTAQILTVFGRKGSGKSSFLRWFLQTLLDRPVIIFDHFGEYHQGKNGAVVYSLAEMADLPEVDRVVVRGLVDYEEFWLVAAQCRGRAIVFDEIDKCCDPSWLPDGLNQICQYGRHLDVSLLCASRRPARVHRNITSQADYLVCFQVREPRDLAYIREFAGEAYSQELPYLETGECVIYPQDVWFSQPVPKRSPDLLFE